MSAISSCLHGYTNMCPHCTYLTDATVGVRIPDFAGTFVFSSGPVPTQPDNALRELAKLKTEHPKIAAAADALADGLSMTDPTTTPAPSDVPDGYEVKEHPGQDFFSVDAVVSQGRRFRTRAEAIAACHAHANRQREFGREEERAHIARILGLSPEALAHLADGPPDLTPEEVEHGRRLIEEGRRLEREAHRDFMAFCWRLVGMLEATERDMQASMQPAYEERARAFRIALRDRLEPLWKHLEGPDHDE